MLSFADGHAERWKWKWPKQFKDHKTKLKKETTAAARSAAAQVVPLQGQDAVVDSVFDLLIRIGFDERAARRLAQKRPKEIIQRQIEWLPLRASSRNRLGLLRRAIEQDWSKPEGVAGTESTSAFPFGKLFASHYYAGYHGYGGEAATEPFPKDIEMAATFIARLLGQHEKKTNARAGHDDIVALIDALQKTTGDAQWEVIRKNFEAEQVVNYFAVNTVLSHWDGFFNNYFAYHDTHGNGKWTMYPWDQDSTWGLRDMRGPGQVFYNMPITFGMNGDQPPSGGFGFGGGGEWWRQPGWFSGPLLANPQFRKVFLARTKEILETIYTEENFASVIAAMEKRLEPEVKIRTEILQSDPVRAAQSFKNNLAGCLEHLRKRREFLLAQGEIKTAGKFSGAELKAPSAQS